MLAIENLLRLVLKNITDGQSHFLSCLLQPEKFLLQENCKLLRRNFPTNEYPQWQTSLSCSFYASAFTSTSTSPSSSHAAPSSNNFSLQGWEHSWAAWRTGTGLPECAGTQPSGPRWSGHIMVWLHCLFRHLLMTCPPFCSVAKTESRTWAYT